MKMRDTKAGDIVKISHSVVGEIIVIILPDTSKETLQTDMKVYIIPTKVGASTGLYFTRYQYETNLADEEVTLLRLRDSR